MKEHSSNIQNELSVQVDKFKNNEIEYKDVIKQLKFTNRKLDETLNEKL